MMQGNPMNLTIDLPEEKTAALAAKARAQGLSTEEYARQVLEHDLAPNGSKSRGRAPRTPDLIECPPTRSPTRSPRRDKRGATPGCNRVHDTGRSRHQHYRFGPLAAARPAQILMLALSGLLQLCVSGAIYAEYEEVISRPRFGRDPDIIAATLGAIRGKGVWVKPTEAVTVCGDPDDNVFLECAEAAQALYLVTGNLRHFPASWKGTQVVTARTMLQAVRSGTPTNPA
jgi:predicted nucleic acid-binding protein